ncbi:MAG TPA: sugar transferase, partial [Burkholderiaceae bacterium]|nr:sugar transferase [Burkholderiaceae bacterium]
MAAILSLSLQLHEPSRGEAWGQQLHTLMHQVLAAVLLLLLWPLMVWAAWRIWRHDGAPVLFAHYRVGRHGKLFRCLKFRTMHHESQQRLAQVLANDPMAREQWQRDQKLADDPRVTPVGRFLRQTSLDELP